jgi:hypothetical protein
VSKCEKKRESCFAVTKREKECCYGKARFSVVSSLSHSLSPDDAEFEFVFCHTTTAQERERERENL